MGQCGGECVLLDSDPEHCGDCDLACPPGIPCTAGECIPECTAEETLCGDACVATENDEAHCGSCDLACPGDQYCAFGQCVDTTINYVLIGGQSLSIGAGAGVVSTQQPYDNVMLNTGVRAGAFNLVNFVPLIEKKDGPLGETIASGMANLLAEFESAEGRQHVMAASAHGVSGRAYYELKKGTNSFSAGMAQVAAAAEIATAQGDRLAVRAVAMIHGESDHGIENSNYEQDLLQWQGDYEADIRAITGQAHPVPMFLCQISTWTMYGKGHATSVIPKAQLSAADARPERIFVVGPKYFFPYVDGVHLNADGERWLGEYYAKVYRKVLIDGERWIPVRPLAQSRDGAVITVDFHVPEPPLVFDTEGVSDPGNLGFEYWDDSDAPPSIVNVELSGDAQVQVTLSAEPTADNKRIRYAYTGVFATPGGPNTGPRGNLRDSDSTQSRHDYPLYNWSVHFDEPVD